MRFGSALAPLDEARAADEHRAMIAAYEAAGVTVHQVAPPAEPSPNLMFCADLFVMTPAGAILARPASTVRAINPDGIFLSNGPGDPEPLTYAIDTVRELLDFKPLFGICLGHQILALAAGAVLRERGDTDADREGAITDILYFKPIQE